MDVKKLINKALSDEDIGTILGTDANIIRYSELRHIDDLGELLAKKDIDYCSILYDDRPDRGHWAALSKYNGIYEHFDSYGNKNDKTLEWVNMKMRWRLNEATPYLTNLLKSKQYIYNNVKYQDRDGYVNTCGPHVVHKLYRLTRDGMDLQTYHDYMEYIEDMFGANYDIRVAEFIKKWI
ncbi:MAG: hypothetical protein ACKPKO_61460 [Candidatus Fonsibacter sp.]